MNGVERVARLRRARLYVVTDARRAQSDLAAFLDAILGAGVDIVQLREKHAEAGDLLRAAEVFRDATARHGALFFINDRPDVAHAAGADGVHVGQNDLPPGWARHIMGPELLIGLSTHTAEQFDTAPADADYLCAGPVHATPTKPGRDATGLELVRHAAASAERRPWFAIGGIDAATLPAVAGAGATRVAVVRAVANAPDAGRAVNMLLTQLAATQVPV